MAKNKADLTAARELKIFIDNDGQLYKQQTRSIEKNLCRRRAKKTYDHKKSVKLWKYLADSGAKKYAKTSGSNNSKWFEMFDVPTREATAKRLADDFRSEAFNICPRRK